MPKPKRQIVLVLVEGRSDYLALSSSISKLFDEFDSNLEVEFLYPKDDGYSHDITCENVKSGSIAGIINKAFIADFLDKNKLYPKNIKQVIQIVDMDGAFIPDDNVVQSSGEIVYAENAIETRNVSAIRERNHIKQRNIDVLTSMKTIDVYQGKDAKAYKTIPYSVFYFSCNLDHFLYGISNLDGSLKVSKARLFSDKCRKDDGYFIKHFLSEPLVDKKFDYYESWEYIKKDVNSLQAHSNLYVLIQNLISG